MSLGNLLIVDDEEMLVKNIQYLLRQYAQEIFVAHNGHEALEVVENNVIHCVICDISMPRMNGLEFLKRIRESGNEVPFIFYTAYGQSDLMLQAAQYGAFDFLRKPDFENLEETIVRGLKEGFSRKNQVPPSVDMSEYEKILVELNKISS